MTDDDPLIRALIRESLRPPLPPWCNVPPLRIDPGCLARAAIRLQLNSNEKAALLVMVDMDMKNLQIHHHDNLLRFGLAIRVKVSRAGKSGRQGYLWSITPLGREVAAQ
jgi:hypothetical protein